MMCFTLGKNSGHSMENGLKDSKSGGSQTSFEVRGESSGTCLGCRTKDFLLIRCAR